MYLAVDTELMCRLWVDASGALHRLGGLGDAVNLACYTQTVGGLWLGADYADPSPWRVGSLSRAVYVAVNAQGFQ